MNFRTLDLNLLRVFDVVMAERNVTRAAQRLAMTQPAVSNALRRLREATGEELFIPGPSGVTPTPQAAAMWARVHDAIDDLRGAFERQAFDPASDARGFTLAMADATATVLAPALARELPESARIELRIVPLTSRDPRPLLEHGVADAAVGFFPDVAASLAAEGDAAPFAIDPLYRCRYVCVLRRDHPLASSDRALDVDAYCTARHVRVNFAGRPRGFVDEAMARLGRERRVVLTVDTFATAARVVHDSDLVTVLPQSFVAASGLADGLVLRPVPLELPLIDVTMLWHRRHARDVGQRWLRDWAGAIARRVGTRACADAVVPAFPRAHNRPWAGSTASKATSTPPARSSSSPAPAATP